MKNGVCEQSGPLPLVVGVTGHRDLLKEDEARLRQQVAEIFQELAKRHPCTRFRLLSGLAEGADRLVADVVLKGRDGPDPSPLKGRFELVACLPMERSLYESDFETDQSRQEFKELIGRAERTIFLPLVAGNTRTSVALPGSSRDLQYAALGDYLVRHCQILIALWDGEETQLTGGTSSVVDMRLGKARDDSKIDPKHLLDDPEVGPVYHIPTRRRTKSSSNLSSGNRRLLYPFDSREQAQPRKTYERIYTSMECFNRDAVRKFDRLAAARAQSKDWLLPEARRQPFADSPLEALIDHYATADSLALHYQRRTIRSFKFLIFACGLGGLFLFGLFGGGPEQVRAPALLLYLLVIALAYTWYKLANLRKLKTRHLDYRALAEGLRLQIFWTLGGVKQRVADHYLSKQKTELDWIRQAIRSWSEPLTDFTVTPDLALVREHWIEGQRNFFETAARKNAKRHESELLRTQVLLFALVAIAAGAVATVLYAWFSRLKEFPNPPDWFTLHVFPGLELHPLLVIVMAMLPAVAGAMAAYSLKMAFSEQRKQYERMYRLYRRAAERLDEAIQQGCEAKALEIVTTLGEEALTENGDWVLLHRERKIEMPFSV